MNLDERQIDAIVKRVMERLSRTPAGAPLPSHPDDGERTGIFPDVDSAVSAAYAAFRGLMEHTLEKRREMVAAMRQMVLHNSEALAEMAVRETGFGRAGDKVKKNDAVAAMTPGVEDLVPVAYSGDYGLTIMERAPWGVIGAVTPVTNPSSTIICNSIGMIAAGNAVVFNPHPRAKAVSLRVISLLNRAVMEAGGPKNIFTAVEDPTIETAQQVMAHPLVKLLVVTGGSGVVREAMKHGKKVIGAGPGNPPVVVDETADLLKAARDIINGASFDNNVVCSDEKSLIVVSAAADQLKRLMKENGAYEINSYQADMLKKVVLQEDRGPGRSGQINTEHVGQDASVLLGKIGITAPPDIRLIITEAGEEHPFVHTELLMPILPMVRVRDVDEGIDLAVKVERGLFHTAVMHSKNIEKLHKMARAVNTAIFVKNGPSYCGLGVGGEGHASFTIAGPTGEGLTSARHFTRERRCTLLEYFRIV